MRAGWPLHVEMIEMLGAERLVHGRIGDAAVHGAPGLHAGAAAASATPCRCTRRATICIGSTPRRSAACDRWRRGRFRCGSRTAAPASWRRRTRWPRFVSAPRTATRAFECDVKLSADGVPFLLHDDTLERTTNGQGVAGERSWAELSRLDAGSWHSSGIRRRADRRASKRSPRSAPRNGHALDIEIKPSPGTEEETGRVVAQSVRKLWRGAPRRC